MYVYWNNKAFRMKTLKLQANEKGYLEKTFLTSYFFLDKVPVQFIANIHFNVKLHQLVLILALLPQQPHTRLTWPDASLRTVKHEIVELSHVRLIPVRLLCPMDTQRRHPAESHEWWSDWSTVKLSTTDLRRLVRRRTSVMLLLLWGRWGTVGFLSRDCAR